MAQKAEKSKAAGHRFLSLFREHRELEKDLEREAALADSLERYIDALEGRDKDRLLQIAELESMLQERDQILHDLRERLSGMLPGH
jgi:hypothetical protein